MRAQPESVSCVPIQETTTADICPSSDRPGPSAAATITHPYMDPSCNLDGTDGIRTQSIARNGDDAMMMQPQNAHGRSKEQAVLLVLLKDHKSKIRYLVKHLTLKKRGFMCGNNTVSLSDMT